jgi:hypothetical protein
MGPEGLSSTIQKPVTVPYDEPVHIFALTVNLSKIHFGIILQYISFSLEVCLLYFTCIGSLNEFRDILFQYNA